MTCSIQPIEEERCVCLSYEGEISPREIAAARYEAQALLNARGWSRVVVDLTRLQSIPTSPHLFDFAKGFAGPLPPDARIALVVCPEQVRNAKVIEKVARKSGVFLSYFIDPRKAALWMQRSQAFRQKLAREPLVEESNASESIRLSTQAQDFELRRSHYRSNFFDRRCAASPI